MSALSMPPSALPMLYSRSRKPVSSTYRSARVCMVTVPPPLRKMADIWTSVIPTSRAKAARFPP